MHRHEMGEAPRRGPGLFGGFRAGVGLAARADMGRDGLCRGGDRRCLEQRRDRQIDIVGLADPGEETHRDQRVPAQIKEAVVNADPVDAEQFFPEARQRALDIGLRRAVIGTGLGPPGASCRGIGLSLGHVRGLDQVFEIKRRDHRVGMAIRLMHG